MEAPTNMLASGSAVNPPRAVYGALMAGFVGAGVLAAYLIGGRGSAETANFAALAVAIAGLIGFLPAIFRFDSGMQTWGLIVFGSSMARMLALLALAFFFAQVRDIVKQPYWLGVVSGGVLILFLETAAAFVILNRHETARARQQPGATRIAGSSTES
ncbi:MAG: hypothetical protein JNM86_09465 [Phycisphaerae bacterium]|nr:hypothetical protein [Phycisphaerae bacterium]